MSELEYIPKIDPKTGSKDITMQHMHSYFDGKGNKSGTNSVLRDLIGLKLLTFAPIKTTS